MKKNKYNLKCINKNNFYKGISITDKFADHIRFFINKNKTIGFKITLNNSGCAGLSYMLKKIDFESEIKSNDLLFTYEDIKIYIPLKIMSLIDGTEIDYIKDGLNYILKFNNPKAKNICGCGESFSIE
ncbi:MAG: iron-sulfur cluster assembly accessory protein [Enterobacterales bacterium]